MNETSTETPDFDIDSLDREELAGAVDVLSFLRRKYARVLVRADQRGRAEALGKVVAEMDSLLVRAAEGFGRAVVTAPTSAEQPDVIPVEEIGALRTRTLALAAEHERLYSELERLGKLADQRRAQVVEVSAERDRFRAALERIAEDGGGLDVFLPVETLQGIARETLGGDS